MPRIGLTCGHFYYKYIIRVSMDPNELKVVKRSLIVDGAVIFPT